MRVDKAIKERIIDLVYNLYSRPAHVHRNNIMVKYVDGYLDIIMFGNYHIKLYPEEPWADVAGCDCGGGYGRQDLEYAAEIMGNRNEILELAQLELE